ncbi:MAG: cytochrome c [Planctomycetes bacterium]|nr:cytochrome c [Planctomycetota bacterium]
MHSTRAARGGPAAFRPPLPPPGLAAEKPVDYPGVHNLVAYAPALYSGSVPEGDSGFDSLARMGIKTIISVDGADPEVELASRHGLRYVHLPIGYNGMERARALEIARAAKELPGPIYIHCHHGKHRSAGAAGSTAVLLGLSSTEHALARMQVSGTAANYTGLFQCVKDARPVDEPTLHSVSGEFASVYRTTDLVKSMVHIDDALEDLKAIEKAAWKVPSDHPDLVPAAEAGRLADLLRQVLDEPQAKDKPADFRELMLASSHKAEVLEEGFTANLEGAELGKRMKALVASCKDCHTKYRD